MQKASIVYCLSLCGLLFQTGCFLPGYVSGIPGSGTITTVKSSAMGFTKVHQTASGSVAISQGDEESVSITTDDNLQQYLEAVVENGELVIRNKSEQNLAATKGVQISIKLKSLEALRLSGVGSITATGLKCDKLSVRSDGVGSISLQGEANSLDANISGVGNFDSKELDAKYVIVESSGVGSSSVKATESIKVTASGLGSVTYSGRPKDKTVNASGIGKVAETD